MTHVVSHIFVPIKEAADFFEVSTKDVYRWVDSMETQLGPRIEYKNSYGVEVSQAGKRKSYKVSISLMAKDQDWRKELDRLGKPLKAMPVPAPYLERLQGDVELLKEFGAHPNSWDPGITFGNERFNVDLNDQGWGWLKPLLQELKDFRAAKNQADD